MIQSIASVPGAFPPATQPDEGSPRSARDTRSYRDAAASRLPSPVSQRDGDPASSGSEAGGDSHQPSAVNSGLGAAVDSVQPVNVDDGGEPWTVVTPRQVRSTGSLGGRTSNSTKRVHERATSPEENKVLFDKEITVAFAQQNSANKSNGKCNVERPITVDSAVDSSLASITIASPSAAAKGKGPDPTNWGGINLRDEEIDVDIQREQLNSWARKKRSEPSKLRNIVPDTHSNEGTEGARLAPTAVERIEHALEAAKLSGSPAATSNEDSGPWAQLAPNSYLGAAIRGLTGDSVETQMSQARRRRQAKRSKKSKKKKSKTLLKSVAPQYGLRIVLMTDVRTFVTVILGGLRAAVERRGVLSQPQGSVAVWLRTLGLIPADWYVLREPRREKLEFALLEDPMFDLRQWYAKKIYDEDAELYEDGHDSPPDDEDEGSNDSPPQDDSGNGSSSDDDSPPPPPGAGVSGSPALLASGSDSEGNVPDEEEIIRLSGVQVPRRNYAGLQRNAAVPKDFTRVVPKPVAVVTKVNGHPAWALLDSGSVGDFISTTLADQLNVPKIQLQKPLPLQLGSRSKVNFGTKVRLQYQDIDEEQSFDIANLSGYDLILGTPWWFQHGVSVGMNLARVVVTHPVAVAIQGDGVSRIAARAVEDQIQQLREELLQYTLPICKEDGCYSDEIAWLWWFDRQGAIQSTGMDMVQNLPYFAVLLAAFQRFDQEDWGIIARLHPGSATEYKSKSKAYQIQRIDFIPAFLATVIKVQAKTGTDKGNWGLVGRGTRIMTGIAAGSGTPDANQDVVFKFSWPEVIRTSEAEIIWKACQVNNTYTKCHLPKLVARYSSYSTDNIRKALGIIPRQGSLHREPRELRLLVTYPLSLSSDHEPEQFMRFWVDWYRCHRILWINQIEHRDISPSNLMVDATDQKYPKGVLNDFDLAVYQPTHVQPGGERTGTIPYMYMALDLLREKYFEGKISRLYRHDLESFIWVLVVATLRMATDTPGTPFDLEKWVGSSSYTHVRSKKLELQEEWRAFPETLAGTNPYQCTLCKFLLGWLHTKQATRALNFPREDPDCTVFEEFENIVAEHWPGLEVLGHLNWPKFKTMKEIAAEGRQKVY
ncbi:hypothetical protein H0H81_009367 [Sphagnurus paluster]|uniref:Protein kinase domain-containing protein n=1 Tax=Sphagnurus paluster TaxID=117069 RepID=A0A9P7FPF7_9AGAR|nr:hypothetical protein H0H81_009367 [Sphagnurus paluster]